MEANRTTAVLENIPRLTTIEYQIVLTQTPPPTIVF